MLLAEKREQEYADYGYALQQQEREQKQKAKQEAQKKARLQAKKRFETMATIFNIAIVFCICVLIISRYGYIAELNFKLHTADKDYKEAMKVNMELNEQLVKNVNLDNLEKVATEKLHMQYPDMQTQVVYINVSVKSKANEKNIYSEYTDVKEVQQNKYINYAKNMLGSVLKVLD